MQRQLKSTEQSKKPVTEINTEVTGFVHSIETLATLDGPGLRTVIFFQGCPLRCQYCHNVDLVMRKGSAEEYTAEKLVSRVEQFRSYWGENMQAQGPLEVTGGVTISGGEPTYQPEFLNALTKMLTSRGIHVTVDTSLFTTKRIIEGLIPYVNYWMISIKQMNNARHKELTGVPNKTILDNITHLDSKLSGQVLRIRYVVLPGMTDDDENVRSLAQFVSNLRHLDVLEILPYTSMGKFKWIKACGTYALDHIREGTPNDVLKVKQVFDEYGIKTKY